MELFLQKYDRASILIPNAIRFYEKRPCSLIRERYGLEQGEYILYVGRISPEKGTMDLVEGYRKAKTGKSLCWSARWTTANIARQYSSRHKMTPISS